VEGVDVVLEEVAVGVEINRLAMILITMDLIIV
jgi:hypothetical protein